MDVICLMGKGRDLGGRMNHKEDKWTEHYMNEWTER